MAICLVLGAGASLANALHFRSQRMRNSLPPLDTTFFETLELRGIQLRSVLRSYIAELLRTDPSPEQLRKLRMEDFFKDLYFDFSESPASSRLHEAYVELIDIYSRALHETTNWLCSDARRGAPIGRLIAAAADVADEVVVITFNHDLVIENEIYRRARLSPRWCLDYGYGSFGEELALLRPTAGGIDEFPVHGEALCDHTRPITVLKLHGSLNWVTRIQGENPTARMLMGEAGQRSVFLLSPRLAYLRIRARRATLAGRGSWETWPVIIPPIYSKAALRRIVAGVWQDARDALAQAERVVFFGYSLPGIDIDAEKLFERSLARNDNVDWIDVVNPNAASAQRYAGLAPAIPVRWYPSLPQFLAIGGF